MAVTSVIHGTVSPTSSDNNIAMGVARVSPMGPLSLPSLLLGLHAMQGIMAGISPTSPDTTTKPMGHLKSFQKPHKKEVDISDYLPRKPHFKIHRLERKLGKHFDSFWMSKELPEDFLDITIKRNTDVTLIPDSQSLDVSSLIDNLYAHVNPANINDSNTNSNSSKRNGSNSTTTNSHLLNRMTETFKSWLVEYSTCPVYYVWQKLDLVYWPRYLRKGMCRLPQDEWGSDGGQSSSSSERQQCSWPPGMHCVPNQNGKRVKVLRWTCRPTRASDTFRRFRQSGRRKTPTHSSSSSTKNANTNNKPEGVNLKLKDDASLYNNANDTRRDNGLSSHHRNSKKNDRSISEEEEEEGQEIPQEEEEGDSSLEDVMRKLNLELPPSIDESRWITSEPRHRPRRSPSKDTDNDNKTEDRGKRKKKNHRRRPRVKCRWVRFPMTAIDECFCSC